MECAANPRIPVPPMLDLIVHSVFENLDYPKERKDIKPIGDNDKTERNTKAKQKQTTQPELQNLDLLANGRVRPISANYAGLSFYHLGLKFPCIPLPDIKTYFEDNDGIFARTFVALKDLEKVLIPKEGQTRHFPVEPPWQNAEFQRELDWCETWHPDKSGEIEYQVLSNPEGTSVKGNAAYPVPVIESEECESGTGIECGCCFAGHALTAMIECPDGHLFCKACVLAFSQERLGQRNATLKCMHMSGCNTEFAPAQLEECLPDTLFSLYERVKQEEEIAANLEDLEECPFCPFKRVIENEAERLFRCMNEECQVISCRSCKEPDHLPKSCAEVKANKTLDAQHTIEEAMSEALIRKCPKCQMMFIKSDGCNKIICSKCGQTSCYICKKAIGGYEHFDQSPDGVQRVGTSSEDAKCPLFDSNGSVNAQITLEERHRQEVDRAREEAIAKLRKERPEVDFTGVNVGVPLAPRTS